LGTGIILTALMFSLCFAANPGFKKRSQRPHEYGNVVMNNFSEMNNMSPVVFNHWLHRAEYTCRLCHIDLGFGMKPDSTEVAMDDNNNMLYCGACHDGKEAFPPVEKDKMGNELKNCYRCHSFGKKVTFETNYYQFLKGFPRARYGNKVDWLIAEEKGLIKLKDFLEGHSFGSKKLSQTKDISIRSKEMGITDIIFSHKKHTTWNGCELCHPEIFGVKKGSTQYNMQDVFEGRFCGGCHGSVAFPNTDCMLCHTTAVY
jgi:c(7)-type cytochrome triheme protein